MPYRNEQPIKLDMQMQHFELEPTLPDSGHSNLHFLTLVTRPGCGLSTACSQTGQDFQKVQMPVMRLFVVGASHAV